MGAVLLPSAHRGPLHPAAEAERGRAPYVVARVGRIVRSACPRRNPRDVAVVGAADDLRTAASRPARSRRAPPGGSRWPLGIRAAERTGPGAWLFPAFDHAQRVSPRPYGSCTSPKRRIEGEPAPCTYVMLP